MGISLIKLTRLIIPNLYPPVAIIGDRSLHDYSPARPCSDVLVAWLSVASGPGYSDILVWDAIAVYHSSGGSNSRCLFLVVIKLWHPRSKHL